MIVGISGLAGVGKDTTADFLVKNHGFVKVSLADPMKRICKELFDFSDEQLWGPSEMRNEPDLRYPRDLTELQKAVLVGLQVPRDMIFPPDALHLTPRHALQQLGTEWGRNCYENVWVDYTLRLADRLKKGGYAYDSKRGLFPTSSTNFMSPNTDVVIPDVRFKNEMKAIKKAGGLLIRIYRSHPGLSGAAGQHRSETEQKEVTDNFFDAILHNDTTLEDLELASTYVYERLPNTNIAHPFEVWCGEKVKGV